jgi:hypothetical protein
MKAVAEYQARADECRLLARKAQRDAERDALNKMAETWNALAADRSRNLDRRKRIIAIESELPPARDKKPD